LDLYFFPTRRSSDLFMLACWLAMSPFIFGHVDSSAWLTAHDFAVASLIALFALGSYWHRTRHAHLLTVLVALWMIGFGRFGSSRSEEHTSELQSREN